MENKKITCPHCGSTLSERQIAMFDGLVLALWNVFKWCEQSGIHEFKRKDIKHLLHGDNQTARFGDWVLFGGLVYKPNGKGSYGLNIQRCQQFFSGSLSIPTSIWKNPITKELRKEDYKFIHEIPSLGLFLDENQMYIARYREPQPSLF